MTIGFLGLLHGTCFEWTYHDRVGIAYEKKWDRM
jgi:hypothetical protein